ncbi:peptidase C14, caspase domain-containing protein [Amylostereum chailletii]|nr:peptidase C14, caspase domain-containing protein [Amylostereum chailletii]
MNLQGCVTDAHLLRRYLVSDLSVPTSHITLLTSNNYQGIQADGLPTRASILNALYSLRDNAAIQYGDNMVFYFSGRGSSYNPRGYFESDAAAKMGPIEALCPADRGAHLDISDRELNVILAELRDEKGPNITVILDCCFSNETTHTTGAVARYVPPLPHSLGTLLRTVDEDTRRRRPHASVLSEGWREDMSSHVVMAACQSYELTPSAQMPTQSKYGAFTTALVTSLRSSVGKDPTTTYQTLMRSVVGKLQRQTAVVAGSRVQSRLWFCDSSSCKLPDAVYTARRPR